MGVIASSSSVSSTRQVKGGAAFRIDAASLPSCHIVELAQKNILLRAERQTPENGIPVFITHTGWDELIAHYGEQLSPGNTENSFILASRLLSVLERFSARLFSEIIEHNPASSSSDSGEESKMRLEPCYTLSCDLFPTAQDCLLLFRRDISHSVICAILGTEAHFSSLRDIIMQENSAGDS